MLDKKHSVSIKNITELVTGLFLIKEKAEHLCREIDGGHNGSTILRKKELEEEMERFDKNRGETYEPVKEETEIAVNVDPLVIFQKSIETLRDLTKIQCNDGNWNYDPYMHGMANGMILALSLFEVKAPAYLKAPDIWLKDIPGDGKPIGATEI